MGNNNELFELISKMYSEIQTMRSEVNEKFDNLEKQVNKNSLLLEKMENNIKLLAEGQDTIINQIGVSAEENKNTINSRLEIIELATKSISKDVKFIKHKLHETEEDVFDIKDHLKIIK